MNNGPEHGCRVQTARADTAAAGLLLWLLQLAPPRGLPASLLTAEGCPGGRGQAPLSPLGQWGLPLVDQF